MTVSAGSGKKQAQELVRRGAPAMGETACSPSCAGRPCGRQRCATLLVQEVHHHRHQRLRRHHPPRKQRLLPTLTWRMSVMPATREPEINTTTTITTIIQGPPEEDERRPPGTPPATPGTETTSRPRRDRLPIARTTAGNTFTFGAENLRYLGALLRVSPLLREDRPSIDRRFSRLFIFFFGESERVRKREFHVAGGLSVFPPAGKKGNRSRFGLLAVGPQSQSVGFIRFRNSVERKGVCVRYKLQS